MRALFLCGLLLGLAGCSGPYSIEAKTEHNIAICWDPLLNREQRAADEAAQHCAARGLIARVQGRSQCGLGNVNRLTSYECVRAP